MSTKNVFCAITLRRYNDPPELCGFQAKLVSSSERCPCKSWPFTELLANVESEAPALPASKNQPLLRQVPCCSTVG